jgi:ParB family chromosome partitioning protein
LNPLLEGMPNMSTKDRPRLGRGLKGLISSTPVMVNASGKPPVNTPTVSANEASGGAESMQYIDVTLIDPNPHQPRGAINPESLAELVASIKTSGVLQPVIVRPAGTRYQLVAGHRRTLAAQKAGLATIPAVVRNDAGQGVPGLY